MPQAKHLYPVLLFLFLFTCIRAQDVIYLTNGSKIQVTVKEINEREIKYKNFTTTSFNNV